MWRKTLFFLSLLFVGILFSSCSLLMAPDIIGTGVTLEFTPHTQAGQTGPQQGGVFLSLGMNPYIAGAVYQREITVYSPDTLSSKPTIKLWLGVLPYYYDDDRVDIDFPGCEDNYLDPRPDNCEVIKIDLDEIIHGD